MIWRSAPVDATHDVSNFRCGRSSLDDWLRTHALRAQGAGVSRTTVWTAPGQVEVVAYHAIAPAQFARAELPSRALGGGFSIVPGFLIGRLALDVSLHGQGLGGELLHDALRRIVAAADTAGGRIIAVDALDDAASSFYRRHDFQPIAGSDRLVMKVSTARAALGS